MDGRFYLTDEERLRLGKLLEHVSESLLHEDEYSHSFKVIRRSLTDFIHPLSPISKTKELIEKLLSLTEADSLDLKRRVELGQVLKALHSNLRLEELNLSPKKEEEKSRD